VTKNEKAASFANWKPRTRCPGLELPTDWFSQCCYCGKVESDSTGQVPEHYEPAPDMTKAQYYMDALLGLKRFEWILSTVKGGYLITIGRTWSSTGLVDVFAQAHATTCGAAVVMALAEFHDWMESQEDD
jgi:hypothetical protein